MTATAGDTFAPAFERAELVPVGDWRPARYTPSLTGTEEFATLGDRLLAVVDAHWSTEETPAAEFTLDPWQRWLIRHLLEVYPDDWPVEHLRGQLRFRQYLVSMGRQNGKSLLAAVLMFFYLVMHVRGPRVVGLASREGQARIVYDRVKWAVEASPVLAAQCRATATRGITLKPHPVTGDRRPGQYVTLPAKEDSAQGEPVSGGIYDELHIGLAALWDALVLGQSARPNSQLGGITTAGDDDSDLLLRLYDDAAHAIAGNDERFGAFIWEAATDEVTEANVIAANPAVACGRKPLEQEVTAAHKLYRAPKDKTGVTGKDRCIRYTLNRFVEGSAASWVSLTAWKAGADRWPVDHGPTRVFGLDRTEAWEWVSVTASSRRDDGILVTELAATLDNPDQDTLVTVCKALARAHPGAVFALPRSRFKALAATLAEAGLEVWPLDAGETAAAAATGRAAIARRALAHAGDPLLNVQNGQARKRDLGDSWRLSRSLSTGDIDAVESTLWGLYVATARTLDTGPPIY